MLPRRRPRRAAAVVGLLAGLALLLGAVLDGGMTSPPRGAAPDAIAAVPHSDIGASATSAREDHPAWGVPAIPSRIPGSTVIVLLVAGLALVAPLVIRDERHHDEPATRARRHRGPPVAV